MTTIIKASSSQSPVASVPFHFVEIGNRGRDEFGPHASVATDERLSEETVGQQLDTLLPALSAAIDRIATSKAAWLAHWEKMAVHVATAIAGRIIRREFERAPEITTSLVKEALELAAGTSDICVRLHPDDFQALGSHVERLAAEMGRLGKTQIVADPHISRGGCRVDTRFGTIDQQFEAQLARIEQELAP